MIDPSIAGPAKKARKAAEACPYGAVDLDDRVKEIDRGAAAAVVWATGWTPYDPTKLETYDFDQPSPTW